jgi:hypothetical protein
MKVGAMKTVPGGSSWRRHATPHAAQLLSPKFTIDDRETNRIPRRSEGTARECYVKAAAYQDRHAGYSDPLDEQTFLVDTINRLMQSPEWERMAIIIAYDDSDG